MLRKLTLLEKNGFIKKCVYFTTITALIRMNTTAETLCSIWEPNSHLLA